MRMRVRVRVRVREREKGRERERDREEGGGHAVGTAGQGTHGEVWMMTRRGVGGRSRDVQNGAKQEEARAHAETHLLGSK